jgi:Tfp pilus assembly protein PilO|tara:strand:- start:388 stop:1038 length:651 start_codon:yes stop_codon:yes gene_type:complete
MDLSSLKNMNVNDLISSLKNSELLRDKKFLINFGVGFVAILIFLIGYYFFVSPTLKDQKEKIVLMNDNKSKIEEFKNNIITVSKTIKKFEPEFKKNNRLFHSKKEVEDLYQNISNFASNNGLNIINLKVVEPIGVTRDQNQDQTNTENPQFIYYKIPVDYEIKGNYLGYLKFRRALATSTKVINFDKEEIDVIKEVQGQIISKGTISIVGLPDEYK